MNLIYERKVGIKKLVKTFWHFFVLKDDQVFYSCKNIGQEMILKYFWAKKRNLWQTLWVYSATLAIIWTQGAMEFFFVKLFVRVQYWKTFTWMTILECFDLFYIIFYIPMHQWHILYKKQSEKWIPNFVRMFVSLW